MQGESRKRALRVRGKCNKVESKENEITSKFHRERKAGVRERVKEK